jgi:hypothetical protein
MKYFYTLIICFLLINTANTQEKFLTKSGKITFFSEATMENIEAENNQVLSIVDSKDGGMAIAILMKSFLFEKALMQEHFNENYVESDKYPKATFKGKIEDFVTAYNSTSKIEVKVKGTLTIHGKSKEVTIPATFLKTDNTVEMIGEFYVTLSDFDVKIPAVVAKNIAKKIKVSFDFNHSVYKK